VSGARYNDELYWHTRLKFGDQLAQSLDIAKLVMLSVDQQQRLATLREKTEVILFERRPDPDAGGRGQPDPRPR
jgi:hypothetical protein